MGFLCGEVFGVEGEVGGDFDDAVGGAVGFAGNFGAGGFEPGGVAGGGDFGGGLGGVDAVGVFDGGEFVVAVGFVNDGLGGKGEGVEDEGFEFDAVILTVWVTGSPVSGVDGRDFFLVPRWKGRENYGIGRSGRGSIRPALS